MAIVVSKHLGGCRFPAAIVCVAGALFASLLVESTACAAEPIPETVEFNRDIRPILSDTCYACHGPDVKKRKGELRLDVQKDVYIDRDDSFIVVPGRPEKSELYLRITSDDEDMQMPPADSGRKLTPRQKELIRRWIKQGAKWQKHWSFIAPRRHKFPQVKQSDWPRNGIDHFVLDRLEKEGLSPSKSAGKSTLIRRVTLDLTGLPPTAAEVDAFLADNSANAYEKVVDRLLKSPRYGERMATHWLDAARYADSNGYQTDAERYMWRWRDWVIEAFNANMRFDQFTIEQLAGDLLENPTLEQRIATGFNRNHRGNGEGGVIAEEYAVEYVIDRVETTSTVWLGLTLGCGRCHDHKYDPVTQREFYQLFAFFNNIPEKGRANKYGNSPPVIKAPTRAQRKQLDAHVRRLTAAESQFTQIEPQLAAAQAAWEKTETTTERADWSISDGLAVHFKLDDDLKNAVKKTEPSKTETYKTKPDKKETDNSKLDKNKTKNPEGEKFEDGSAAFAEGRIERAAEFDGKRFVNAGNVGKFGFRSKFSLSVWIKPQGDQGGTILSRMTDIDREDGYSLVLKSGHLHVNLVKRWLDDCLRVHTEARLQPNRWQHLLVTYDGSRVAAGVRIYVDGKLWKFKADLDELNQDFASSEPLRIGGGNGPKGRFHGSIDDVRLYDRVLLPEESLIVATADRIDEILPIAASRRSAGQAAKLADYFLEQRAPKSMRNSRRQVVRLRREKARLIESFPTVMVMEEMDPPRVSRILIRGQYDKPGEKVDSGVPSCLPPMPTGAQKNRLGLARWLVDPANPLPARVTVNRYWQNFFGTGLVETTEDFGSQGDRPTHPKLLDWLATEFIRNGWDMKAIQKTIVMSATYQQSSKVTELLLEKDPRNQLLARGPRVRLSAQVIRDQALFASGLLVESLGGPSVKPYQPAGLWEEVSGTVYKPAGGKGLYRRSLYTFWKRTVASPTMMTFDASPREMCSVSQTRTNTPLQALVLMNDITFVEAARVLAERVLQEAPPNPEDRIGLAFQLVASRRPQPAEMKILMQSLKARLSDYQKNTEAAKKLIKLGASQPNKKLDPAELAAYTTLTSLILNLDEAVTKE